MGVLMPWAGWVTLSPWEKAVQPKDLGPTGLRSRSLPKRKLKVVHLAISHSRCLMLNYDVRADGQLPLAYGSWVAWKGLLQWLNIFS